MIDHLHREANFGGYESADDAGAAVNHSYASVARLIGAEPKNIAVVENATVAFFQALSAFDFREGDIIVTTRNDYISNQLAYLSLAKRHRVVIERAADLP
ncbi:MAG: aminotransferase, partial [Acidobacteria bacterium]